MPCRHCGLYFELFTPFCLDMPHFPEMTAEDMPVAARCRYSATASLHYTGQEFIYFCAIR